MNTQTSHQNITSLEPPLRGKYSNAEQAVSSEFERPPASCVHLKTPVFGLPGSIFFILAFSFIVDDDFECAFQAEYRTRRVHAPMPAHATVQLLSLEPVDHALLPAPDDPADLEGFHCDERPLVLHAEPGWTEVKDVRPPVDRR
ncbi:MAG: hypothetical protein GY759_12885, partial [Chloroflexi bacterium]|nr:hypothetical protein [Chloroflexota bacterium]